MANPTAVSAGDDVLAAWGNLVINRLVPIFADDAARDLAIPAPEIGQICFNAAENIIQIWRTVNAIATWNDVLVRNRDQTLASDDNSHFVQVTDDHVQIAAHGTTRFVTSAADTKIRGPNAMPLVHITGSLVIESDDPDDSMVIESGGHVQLPKVLAGSTQTTTPIGVFAGSARIFKSSSSERYKQDLSAWTPPDTLHVPLTRWRYAGDVDELGHAHAPFHIGPTAEAINAAGLAEFVVYDAAGRPETVLEGQLALAQNAVLQAQIDRLEARIATLEGKT